MRPEYGQLQSEDIESTRGRGDDSIELPQISRSLSSSPGYAASEPRTRGSGPVANAATTRDDADVPPPNWFMRHPPHDAAENACCVMFMTHVTKYLARASHNEWICGATYLCLGLAPVLGTLPQAAALLSPGAECAHEDRLIRLWHAIGTFAFCLPWPFLFHGLRKVAYLNGPNDATQADDTPGGRQGSLDRTLTVDIKTVAQLKAAEQRVAESFTRGHHARLQRIEEQREASGCCCETLSKDHPGALHSLRSSEWGMECNLDQAKHLFDKFDKDRDGSITAEELLQVLGRLHEGTRAELPLAKVKEMIAQYDLNGDGCIDVKEFIEMMLEEPVRKIISQKAMKSLENQAMVMVGLGLLMFAISAVIGVGLVMLILLHDQSNIDANLDKIAQPARGVLDHYLPDDGCVPDLWISRFQWLLLLVPFPAALVASFIVPAWLLSLRLGVILAADCMEDILRKLAPIGSGDESHDDRLLRQEFTDEGAWARHVQHPVAMLVETMRHLSDWGTAMGAAVLCYLLFALTMLPTAMASSSWWGVVNWSILLAFLAIPFYLAWGPATVSSACDDLLDQLNDLSFVGTDEHRERVARLRTSLMNLHRNQGLGFTVRGTVVNRRMLVKIMLSGSSFAATVVTTMLALAEEDQEEHDSQSW